MKGTGLNMRIHDLIVDASCNEFLAEAHRRAIARVTVSTALNLPQMAYPAGITTVAKTADPNRQLKNLEIFDFELTPEEIHRINAFDTGGPARLDPDEYAH